MSESSSACGWDISMRRQHILSTPRELSTSLVSTVGADLDSMGTPRVAESDALVESESVRAAAGLLHYVRTRAVLHSGTGSTALYLVPELTGSIR